MPLLGTYLVLAILGFMVIKNVNYFVYEDIYHKGYVERKAVAAFITQDAKAKNLLCVTISYIAAPGEGVGFRYFFWLDNLKTKGYLSGAPVYSIVFPSELSSPDEVVAKFGHIGVSAPGKIPSQDELQKICTGENANLTHPMFGYTD